MTVYDLINELQEAIEDGIITEDSQIVYASQPRWPFENQIDDEIFIIDNKVYLKEDHQIGYLPDEVKEEMGW